MTRICMAATNRTDLQRDTRGCLRGQKCVLKSWVYLIEWKGERDLEGCERIEIESGLFAARASQELEEEVLLAVTRVIGPQPVDCTPGGVFGTLKIEIHVELLMYLLLVGRGGSQLLGVELAHGPSCRRKSRGWKNMRPVMDLESSKAAVAGVVLDLID